MRRKDREMDREFGLRVIDRAEYMSLAMTSGAGDPYVVPLSFVRIGERIYFHCAQSGKKIELLTNHPRVCACFVTDVRVPNFMTEERIENAVAADQLSELSGKVFTTEFSSCYIEGECRPISDDEEKFEALYALCERYTPDRMKYASLAIRKSLNHTMIFAISIESLSAKRKAFDSDGNELKWGKHS